MAFAAFMFGFGVCVGLALNALLKDEILSLLAAAIGFVLLETVVAKKVKALNDEP